GDFIWLLLFGDDYDLSARVAFFQIADRGLRLTDFVGAVDHRSDFSGLHEVAQNIQIVFGQFCDVKGKLLIGKVGQKSVPEIPTNMPQHSRVYSGTSNSSEDTNAVGFQNPSAFGERMVANQVVDHVVMLIRLGEIFFGVIDYAIRSDRFHQIDISRAANSRDVCAERFRDLNRESANSSGCAVDQGLLSGLNVPFVAQTLQCRQPGNGDRTRLFECDVARFHHNGALGLDTNVIRHRAVLRA